MRVSRIKSESSGRYMLAEVSGREDSFEEDMILSIAAQNLLKPSILYEEGKKYFCWNITDCRTLKEYLNQESLSEQELCRLMIQLNSACETVTGYLLNEGSLLLGEEQIFVDKNDEYLLFCAVPEESEHFTEELHAFTEMLLMHADLKDSAAVSLCVRLFRESADEKCRLYDLMNEIIQNRKNRETPEEDSSGGENRAASAGAPAWGQPMGGGESPFGRTNSRMNGKDTGVKAGTQPGTQPAGGSPFEGTSSVWNPADQPAEQGKKAEKKTLLKGKPKNPAFPQPQYENEEYKSPLTLKDLSTPEPFRPLGAGAAGENENPDFSGWNYGEPGGNNEFSGGKEEKKLPDAAALIIKILVAELLLGTCIAAVYFLKGKELFLRVLPFYGVLAAVSAAYLIISFFISKKQKKLRQETVQQLEQAGF